MNKKIKIKHSKSKVNCETKREKKNSLVLVCTIHMKCSSRTKPWLRKKH